MVVRGRDGRPAESLVHDAPCPVAVAPTGYARQPERELRRIGVAFDGWDESRLALGEATLLADGAGGELVTLMVADPHTAASAAPCKEDEALLGHRTAAQRYLARSGINGEVLDGPVAPALREACRSRQLDLLVLGSRRHGAIARVFAGGVSTALLRDPPICPLIVCPRGVAAPSSEPALAGAGAGP
jgi:nucleotide-binding universal stress UspA family protein